MIVEKTEALRNLNVTGDTAEWDSEIRDIYSNLGHTETGMTKTGVRWKEIQKWTQSDEESDVEEAADE